MLIALSEGLDRPKKVASGIGGNTARLDPHGLGGDQWRYDQNLFSLISVVDSLPERFPPSLPKWTY